MARVFNSASDVKEFISNSIEYIGSDDFNLPTKLMMMSCLNSTLLHVLVGVIGGQKYNLKYMMDYFNKEIDKAKRNNDDN